MKAILKLALAALFLFTVFAGLSSCKKTYLTDGGVNNPVTALSTYDYLKNDRYQRFDTVLALVDHFKLKDSLNKAVTCFAFTDYSVKSLITSLNATSLKQLTDSVSSKLITQYMFNMPLTLDNTIATAVQYNNLAGTKAPSGVKKTKNVYYVSLINSTPAFNYYTLNYIKINGVLDGSPNAPANDKVDVTLSCQTTGIKTASGTILHILGNNAPLNKL